MTLVGAWAVCLVLAPLLVAWFAGAVPLRFTTGGILFDLSAVGLGGYRALLLAPILSAIACGVAGLLLRPTRASIALGMIGFAFAGTELVLGGGLGIGPGGQILIGTDLRWVWRICAVAVGLVIALTGAVFVRTNGEDHEVPFAPIRRDLLLTGMIAGALILFLSPGPMLGKVMSGLGSWLGSLVWVMAL